MPTSDSKIVESQVYSLETLFQDKFDVDFYQREYVWQKKQVEDLVMDLSMEFLKNWSPSDPVKSVSRYDAYYMGEIVLSVKSGERSAIIDGQQRITSLTLLLIHLVRSWGHVPGFPDLKSLIYSDYYGEQLFNLDIEERRECMLSLLNTGDYKPGPDDSPSVTNIVDRFADISDCWHESIDASNVVHFAYWLKSKVMFSKVWTNSDEFAYVIFETMNDRGLSLTQVEMLRSYLLANIDAAQRDKAMDKLDAVVKRLSSINLSSKSKAEFDFFKVFLRGHYAEDLSQSPTSNSDFIRIGKEFHRWVRDSAKKLGHTTSSDFVAFIDRIDYFSRVYEHIYDLIHARDTNKFLYLIVNADYGFTLQPALILASVCYGDPDNIVDEKVGVVSKYLTKVLTWRVWRHYLISQSSLEASVYDLCKQERGLDVNGLRGLLAGDPIQIPSLENAPTLNQQNRKKLLVLVSLVTEIVARESGEPDYPLNHPNMEVEHIWANHFDEHVDEFSSENEFASVRNRVGDLLVLPKSFNASYRDAPYVTKVVQYFSQNILAQSLCDTKYVNAPGFAKFRSASGLQFKPYDAFPSSAVDERSELYRQILLWNWS